MAHKRFQNSQNVREMTSKDELHLCAKLQITQLYFVGVVVSTIYKKMSFLCWCISRMENTSGLNSWYKKFVRQTINLGALIGNTSQIRVVSA